MANCKLTMRKCLIDDVTIGHTFIYNDRLYVRLHDTLLDDRITLTPYAEEIGHRSLDGGMVFSRESMSFETLPNDAVVLAFL